MEGITQIKTGKLVSLSEQELVDCDTSGIDQGCEGGLMDNAFDFIVSNKGLRSIQRAIIHTKELMAPAIATGNLTMLQPLRVMKMFLLIVKVHC